MTVERLRDAARETLPIEIWDYLEASAGRGREDSEMAWNKIRLRPRILRGIVSPDPRITLLGEALDLPVLLAPAGRSTRYHAAGEQAVVTGAAAAGTIAVLPSSIAHDAAAPAAQGRVWQQLYPMADSSAMRAILAESEAIGVRALVLTVDLLPGSAPSVAPPPRAAWETKDAPATMGKFCGATIDDLARICTETRLPVLVKGVLRGDDAVSCVRAGAAGLIVSNHGGNQLDGAVSSATALPEVVDAVDRAGVVLVDGGIRTGSDIMRALALGADAVLIARPTAYALAVGGSDGVSAMVSGLREELVRAMALCGVDSIADIDRTLLQMS